jgi:hypothetical protein
MLLVVNLPEDLVYVLNLVNHDVSGLKIQNLLNT